MNGLRRSTAKHVPTLTSKRRGLARAGLFSLLCALSVPAIGAAAADEITLPSGREVNFHDVIWGEPGPAGLTVRFRFLEPGLGEVVNTLPYADVEADMQFLCESYALARIASTGPQPSQVVVSISDRPVPFGEPSPDVVQIFEAYAPENGACIWEGF